MQRRVVVFGGWLLLMAWSLAVWSQPDPLREKAVQIAYRIDHELGLVDAAQRHALVARLLVALESGELTPASALDQLWIGWEARLEGLESASGLRELPIWHEPFMPDAVSVLVQSVRIDQDRLVWTAPALWTRGTAWTALLDLTDPATGELPISYYPGLLAWARSHAPDIWHRLLVALQGEPEWQALIAPLVRPWLALSLDAPLADWRRIDDRAAVEIKQLVAARDFTAIGLLGAEITLLFDESLLADRWRRPRLTAAPYLHFLHAGDDAATPLLLSIARGVHRLDRGEYAELVGALVSLAVRHVEQPLPADRIEALLAQLDRLDPLLPDFLARVDPRLINVYQQTRRLLRDPVGGADWRHRHLRELATLHSALGLDVSALNNYLDQPARELLRNELLICFGFSRQDDALPLEPITREQYRGCLRSLTDWSTVAAATPELAGRVGVTPPDALLDSPRVTPWQRINEWVGHVRSVQPDCPLPEAALVNPLEWALGARATGWFVERWPQYADAEAIALLQRVRATGRDTMLALAQVSACASGAEPLYGSLRTYREALAEMGAAISAATTEFRVEHLRPGADVVLAGPPDQQTRYRPADRQILPCSGEPSCDVDQPLPPSNALYSLFDDALLVADQIRLGELQLCYDEVSWVNRRSQSPQVMSSAMASYYGNLSFVLKGGFSTLDQPLFAMRLEGTTEYEYLFGANQPEVLADPCPRELVNTQVHAELPPSRFELVPRRLTYMTADRTHPERVFDQHWATGQEWQDWFVTGRGVEVLERNEPVGLDAAIAQRLAALDEQWNQSVYRRLLTASGAPGEGAVDVLTVAAERLEHHKAMVSALARLAAPRPLERDPELRATLYGEDGLFDRGAVLRLQQRGLRVDQLEAVASERYERARSTWRQLGGRGRDQALLDAEPLLAAALLDLGAVIDRTEAAQRPSAVPVVTAVVPEIP